MATTEGTRTDHVAGLSTAPGDASGTHAAGSALDLRTVLLDPGARLHGEHMRRRGSDISRVRPPAPVADSDGADAIELASMHADADTGAGAGAAKQRPADVESQDAPPSAPPSTAHETAEAGSNAPFVPHAERKRQRRKAMFCFAALCWNFFGQGWNDGSTGPLLPTIQRHYNIGFAIVSLLFVCNTIGYVAGALANMYLSDRFGLGKTIVIGALFQLLAYSLDVPAGPFPLMCAAFCCAGFGLALQNCQGNGFVGSLRDSATKLGFLHASYGLGAFSAPLAATHFAAQQRWSLHYLISVGVTLLNVLFLVLAFRFKRQDEVMAEAGEEPAAPDANGGSKLGQIMRMRTVHFLAVWALIYVGVEVTLGGWIVTFIEQKRGGGASAGYISSGFFGGLMLGRVLLLWLNRKVGERRVMFIYAFLAIQLEVTVWVVPSLVENAIAVSVIGLLLGPMYPILVNHSKNILPQWLFVGCVGWIAGIGQTGSAILPFLTGLLASKFGISSLQPFIVSMMSTMVVIWAFVPRIRRVD